MKKTIIEEKQEKSFNDFLKENIFEDDYTNTQLTHFQSEIALENIPNITSEEYLDKLLTAIKFAFLYIPGVLTLNFLGVSAYFLILFGLNIPFFWGAEIGLALVGAFLTMIGIGKLKDLNYLKVPAAIFTSSILYFIISALITLLIGEGFEGIMFLLSVPLTSYIGYLVKKMIDKNQ